MNLLILLYLIVIAPKLLWDRCIRGKRHPGFLERIGFKIPKLQSPLIWIHAISVGEVKAAEPLFRALKLKHPNSKFLITTTTATGQVQARKSLVGADAIAFAPIDLSWVVRRWVRRLNPRQYILVESDFWPNLLKTLKQNKTHVALVSGKISERSFRRFSKFPFLAKKLFSQIDQLCVQNELYKNRFSKLLGNFEKIQVTGNLKLDIDRQPVYERLAIPQPCIVISCTHDPEENWLLEKLIDRPFSLILAPRHPERFAEVSQLLERKKIPFSRWSERGTPQKVLLVDTMGQLSICYEHARLAILGGSFVDHVGGHNVLEPLLYSTPVIFGPHMQGQLEFANMALKAGAAKQVSLSEVNDFATSFFKDPRTESNMVQSAVRVTREGRGSTERTINSISCNQSKQAR